MMSQYESVMPPMFEPKALKALLIGDSHVNGGQLNQLAIWLHETKAEFDVILVTGNMANLVNKLRTSPACEYQAAEQVVDSLQFFLDHVKKPVIYLPGNTEPSAVFNYEIDMPNAINLHKRAIQLDDNLVIIGLGGSIPVQKDGKDLLEGFPYKTDEEYTKDLDACVDAAFKKFGPDCDYVLLTHLGPVESPTSDLFLGKETTHAGSKGLSELLKKHGEKILCNVHGHSSLAEGMCKPYPSPVRVINPGGMTSGRFGELTLTKLPTGKWTVQSVQFHNVESL